ncbi:Hypothetical protein FKW44_013732, partial [Caligus rogercresseyi]
ALNASMRIVDERRSLGLSTKSWFLPSLLPTRSGQSRHRAQLANMATSGSVIAVSRGQYDELEFVQVIKSCGEL